MKISSAVPYLLLALWVIFLRIIAGFQDGHESYRLVGLFIGGWCSYVLLSWVWAKYKRPEFSWKAVPLFFILILSVGTEPLFENDQYRYLWEGKVIAAGHNPYKLAPSASQLNGLDDELRQNVGYNKLVSPYSPLTPVFFSIFYKFPYKTSLIILQIFFALLCTLVLVKAKNFSTMMKMGLAGVFAKEFSQSIHMELLALVPFCMAGIMMTQNKFNRAAFWFSLSLSFKITGLLAFPWFFSVIYRQKAWRSFVPWILGLAIVLTINLLGPLSLHAMNGLKAYMTFWFWHPGLATFLLPLFSLDNIRIICDVLWVAGLLGLYLLFNLRTWSFSIAMLAIFSWTAFARPVYNAWYSPWFSLPAGAFNSLGGLWYSLSAELTYLQYATPANFLFWSVVVVTHLAFFRIVIEVSKYALNLHQLKDKL